MAYNNEAGSTTPVKSSPDIQIEDVVVPNSLSIAAAELLLGPIELAINTAELMEGIVATNSSPTTPNENSLPEVTMVWVTPYSNIIYNSYTNHFLTSPP